MQFLRSLLAYGLFRKEAVRIGGTRVFPEQLLIDFLTQVPEGRTCDLWGYGLAVDVTGLESGKRVQRSFWISHPPQEEWGVPGVYSNNVGSPFAIGTLLVGGGEHRGPGIDAPEGLLEPEGFFERLDRAGIHVHERREVL